MNKYLMLGAAALLAGTASATAGAYCFGFGSANGGSFCDGGILYTGADGGAFHNAVRIFVHTNDNCNGGTSEGFGILGKTKGFGDYSTMSDDSYAKNYGIYSEFVAYSLPKKIKDGQPWVLWLIADTTTFEGNAGVLVNVSKCQAAPPPGRGRTSTLAGLKAMLEARRAKKS